MKLGSLFDGSGGFPLAGAMCGIEPVWGSEVKPYAIAVTRSRFPAMRHLGDVSKINGAEIEPVDIITFGSPCQDMSVAGKRAGMKHEGKGDDDTTRSGMFYEAIRIMKEMRQATNGQYPRIALWENVPGALSSQGGRDFRSVLEELAKISDKGCSIPLPEKGKWADAGEIVGDGFSVAWRVLDAQHWGVPQRRRRVFVVASFTDERAGEILFERPGLRWHSAQGAKTRQEFTGDAGSRAERSGSAGLIYALQGNGIDREIKSNGMGFCEQQSYTLNTVDRHGVAFMAGQGAKAGSIAAHDNLSPTLRGASSGTNQAPTIACPSIFHSLTAKNACCAESAQQPNCVCYPNVARTLTAEHDSSPCIDRGQNVICIEGDGNERAAIDENISGTLKTIHPNTVVYETTQITSPLNYSNPKTGGPCHPLCANAHVPLCVYDARGNGDGNTSPTITVNHENRVTDYTSLCVENGKLLRQYIVRRLTPIECARLQGFPDEWGVPDHKDSMGDDEAAFWEDVRRTYAAINGKKYAPKRNREALLKWYNDLHTDSAEYELWGNGVALPCVLYIMEGIALAMEVLHDQP